LFNMAGNTIGTLFCVTTFGESHGGAIGCVVDGCPPGLLLTEEDIQTELDRRRPGQSNITTSRSEADTIHILSGVFEGKTTGTPILLIAYNTNERSQDYEHLKNVYRPSHADYVYDRKYGIRDYRGGGRSSARETLARVAAGAIAAKYLRDNLGIECISFVEQVGDIRASIDYAHISREQVEQNIVRCPDVETAKKMRAKIEEVNQEGDSLGGVIGCVIRNVPVGLGDPVFDKLSADLGKAMLSINAVKGFEIGSGFLGTTMKGSEHNDSFYIEQGAVKTKTNYSGGIQGGISNGQDIFFRVAFKPVATIRKQQHTITKDLQETTLQAFGRHDPCVVPRAVPIVDAMASLIIMDHYLRHKAQNL
jgi:chorismate synthase